MTATSADFWDRVAPNYSKQAIADTESYARKLAATQALMRPDMKILEFGCGTGSTALELSQCRRYNGAMQRMTCKKLAGDHG